LQLEANNMSSLEDRSAEPRAIRRPDSAILNEAIPVFAIGRSKTGLWVARDCDSSAGGAFLTRAAAIRFAKHTGGACALMFVRDGLELDGSSSAEDRSRDLKAGLGDAIANIKTRVRHWARSQRRAASAT
jgi:hypothetical protein